jgi:cyclase
MRKDAKTRRWPAWLLVLAVPPVYAQGFGSQPAELDLVKLADDLYVIHNDLVPGNVTALITDEGVLLVDDKFAVDYDNMMRLLRTVTEQPVKYVINTHFHPDHSGGNAKFQALDARVVASERARRKMVEVDQPGLPDVTLDRRAFVHLGGKTAEVYYFGRSHTDGDVVVYFPEHRVLAAGDMFTYGDDVPELIDYAGGGSARAWPYTLDGALKLDFDTVVPGHGDVTTKDKMRAYRDETARLARMTHMMVLQKRSRDDIEKMLRSEFHWADLHVQRGLDGLIAEMQ